MPSVMEDSFTFTNLPTIVPRSGRKGKETGEQHDAKPLT